MQGPAWPARTRGVRARTRGRACARPRGAARELGPEGARSCQRAQPGPRGPMLFHSRRCRAFSPLHTESAAGGSLRARGPGGSRPGVGTPAARTTPGPARAPGPPLPGPPAPQDPAHLGAPCAPQEPRAPGPLRPESSAHPGTPALPENPWPWDSCDPESLLPKSPAPRDPGAPREPAHPGPRTLYAPFGCKGPCLGRAATC